MLTVLQVLAIFIVFCQPVASQPIHCNRTAPCLDHQNQLDGGPQTLTLKIAMLKHQPIPENTNSKPGLSLAVVRIRQRSKNSLAELMPSRSIRSQSWNQSGPKKAHPSPLATLFDQSSTSVYNRRPSSNDPHPSSSIVFRTLLVCLICIILYLEFAPPRPRRRRQARVRRMQRNGHSD